MNRSEIRSLSLYEQLYQYSQSDAYPFHMPGHKRRTSQMPMKQFANPYAWDITEIDGFDNLHHAEGILKECMEHTAQVYGTKKSYFLVNGSSCGILSAISSISSCSASCSDKSDVLLMARNCHKAVYHGVFLKNLKTEYVYPQIYPKLWIQGGISPEDVDNSLKKMKEEYHLPKAVLVVSPTYDGMVSDISRIAEIVHRYGSILIVDEAHGAHFPFSSLFPKSAITEGADIVIQSVHKTLPCMTQTALLHVCSERVNIELLEYFLQIYQTSSPSYVLMASIDEGVRYMETFGEAMLEAWKQHLDKFYRNVKNLKCLQVLDDTVCGKYGIVDRDISKIIIHTGRAKKTGSWLTSILREYYHLEVEMEQEEYVLALTTLMDTEEGLQRLQKAVTEIDEWLWAEERKRMSELDGKTQEDKIEKGATDKNQIERDRTDKNRIERDEADTSRAVLMKPVHMGCEAVLTIQEAVYAKKQSIAWKDTKDKVSGEFVYVYPPGIPIVVPGERITEDILKRIYKIKESGLQLQGMKDISGNQIEVVCMNETNE